MSTKLRQYIKTNYTGSNLTLLLHPLTNHANPITLKLTPEQIEQKLLAGLYSEVVDDGTKQNIDSKVNYDLTNAEGIYKAFEVTTGDTAALVSAIDSYGANPNITRDDRQLVLDTIVAAVSLISITAMDKVAIQNNYPRTSAGAYTVTTEAIAKYLELPYTDSTTDDELAVAILNKI